MTAKTPKLRRSVLYMPGANPRAMEKARSLPCDGIIFDLEDAVAADAKSDARSMVQEAVSAGDYGYRELIVRVNGLDTPWGLDDLAVAARLPVDGLLFPKVESAAQVAEIQSAADAAGGAGLPLWLMIETPARHSQSAGGGGGFRADCRAGDGHPVIWSRNCAPATPRADTIWLWALQQTLLVARAHGLDALDGVHLDFRNLDSFRSTCEQGRAMGFDGRTLIHPTQIEPANEVFGFSDEAVADAHAVLEVWEAARAEGKGVGELDGRLIENLHAQEAQRVLAFATALAERN